MEKHFKNKLKNHTVDWDKEELVEPLKEGLGHNKTTFNKKWLLLLPLLLISTCLVINENVLLDQSSLDHREITDNNNSNNSPDPSKIKKPNSSGLDESDNNLSTLKKSNLTSQTSILPEKQKATLHTKQSSEPKDLSTNTKSTNEHTPLIANNIKNTTKLNPTESRINSAPSDQLLPNNSIKINTSKQQKSKALNNNRHTLTIFESLPALYAQIISDSASSFLTNHSFEDLLSIQSATDKLSEEKDTGENKFKGYFMSAHTQFGWVNKSYHPLSNNMNFNEALKNNEKTIKAEWSFSNHLELGYQHPSGWFVQAGFQHQIINEFFQYNQQKSDTIQETSDQTRYFLDQNEDTLFFSGTITKIYTEERIIRHNNQHKVLSVPLNIGFKFRKENFNLFSSAGINYNLMHQFKGRVNKIYEDGTNAIIDNPSFSLKNRMGFQLDFGVDYLAFNRSQLFFKLSYQRTPAILSTQNEQSYQNYFLGTGIRFYIK